MKVKRDNKFEKNFGENEKRLFYDIESNFSIFEIRYNLCGGWDLNPRTPTG